MLSKSIESDSYDLFRHVIVYWHYGLDISMNIFRLCNVSRKYDICINVNHKNRALRISCANARMHKRLHLRQLRAQKKAQIAQPEMCWCIRCF